VIRYLFLKISGDMPLEIRHYTDRSEGLKSIASSIGMGVPPEAYWSDKLHRAYAASGQFNYYLYEVEIF
jgi:hypothetical protein